MKRGETREEADAPGFRNRCIRAANMLSQNLTTIFAVLQLYHHLRRILYRQGAIQTEVEFKLFTKPILQMCKIGYPSVLTGSAGILVGNKW